MKLQDIILIFILVLLLFVVYKLKNFEIDIYRNNIKIEDIQDNLEKINERINYLEEMELKRENEKLEKIEKIESMVFDLKPAIDPKLATKISTHVVEKSKKYSLEPELITAVIFKESSFNPQAKSSVAKGLMQVYPKFHKEKLEARNITKKDLLKVGHNIDVGCEILREYIDIENGNIKKALRRYSGNINRKTTYMDKVLNIYKTYSES